MAENLKTTKYNDDKNIQLITENTGSIVEPGNIGQLVVAIEAIRSRGKGRYADDWRSRAELSYNNEKQLLEYFNLYNRLLKI